MYLKAEKEKLKGLLDDQTERKTVAESDKLTSNNCSEYPLLLYAGEASGKALSERSPRGRPLTVSHGRTYRGS